MRHQTSIHGPASFAQRNAAGGFDDQQRNATPRGFEPLRAEPNGFRVHLLNRSDTVSCPLVTPVYANGFKTLWSEAGRQRPGASEPSAALN